MADASKYENRAAIVAARTGVPEATALAVIEAYETLNAEIHQSIRDDLEGGNTHD